MKKKLKEIETKVKEIKIRGTAAQKTNPEKLLRRPAKFSEGFRGFCLLLRTFAPAAFLCFFIVKLSFSNF